MKDLMGVVMLVFAAAIPARAVHQPEIDVRLSPDGVVEVFFPGNVPAINVESLLLDAANNPQAVVLPEDGFLEQSSTGDVVSFVLRHRRRNG